MNKIYLSDLEVQVLIHAMHISCVVLDRDGNWGEDELDKAMVIINKLAKILEENTDWDV